MTTEELMSRLHTLDDGLLRRGKHKPGREFCALEFESQVRKQRWSDTPNTLPDIRGLNDAYFSDDAARTAAIIPLMAALWDWSLWSTTRKRAWIDLIIIQTVRQIISNLPHLSEAQRVACRAAQTLPQAHTAVYADAAADAAAAAAAAYAAAAADAAAAAAYAADRVKVLNLVCSIWIQAVHDTSTIS